MPLEHDHDPILDACLDEVLAGRRPPDLTTRILAAHAIRSPAGECEPPEPPPVLTGLPPALEVSGGQTVVTLRDRKTLPAPQLRRSANWLTITVAAGVIGVGLTITLVSLRNFGRQEVA